MTKFNLTMVFYNAEEEIYANEGVSPVSIIFNGTKENYLKMFPDEDLSAVGEHYCLIYESEAGE